MKDKQDTIKNKQEYIKISRHVLNCIIGVTANILYWIVYVWQNNLADMGNYKFFSYRFHEIYGIGSILIPAITALWFVWVLVETLRKKTWRKDIVILVILAVLIFLQLGYINFQSKSYTATVWTELVDIPDEEHIVIERDDELIKIKTDCKVTNLVEVGEVYMFHYKYNETMPGEGRLLGIDAE